MNKELIWAKTLELSNLYSSVYNHEFLCKVFQSNIIAKFRAHALSAQFVLLVNKCVAMFLPATIMCKRLFH